MVHKMWSADFKFGQLRLDHHTPEHFTRCFWQTEERVVSWWMAYRTVFALYYLVTWFLSYFNVGREDVTTKGPDLFYFIYLTNWSYTVLTLTALVGFGVTLKRLLEERRKDCSVTSMAFMPWYYKLYWVFHTVSLPSAVCVTGIFWITIYNPKDQPIDVINITTHVLNSVGILVDFALVAHPFRILHMYLPVMYALLYCVFSVIYFFCGGVDKKGNTFIYTILDWNKPGRTLLICFFALLSLILVHLGFWLLHRLKKQILAKKMAKSSNKQGQVNLGMDNTSVHNQHIKV